MAEAVARFTLTMAWRNTNDKIIQVLRIRDFILYKLEHDESLNTTILAAEFGLSERQARRYMRTVITHYQLPVRWDDRHRSFTLRPETD